MPTTQPLPDHPDREDELLQQFLRPGPLRLACLQAAGLAPPPGEISQDELASELGISRTRVRQLERRALLKLKSNPATAELYQYLTRS